MLIGSQNKAILLNFSNLTVAYIVKNDEGFVILSLENKNRYKLGKYSSEAKAMKVLDMIQESYTNEKVAQILSYGLRMVPTEEINEAGKIIKNAIQSSTVFQMPEDSEVEE